MKIIKPLWILLLMVLPAVVQAQFTFTTNADNATLTITGYTGSSGEVTIPQALNGYPVISIGTNAFAGLSYLTNVTITGGITNINIGAFQNCTNLAGVYFQGNAPTADSTLFVADSNTTVYYLLGTTGWDATFYGRPTAPWNNLPVILVQPASRTNLAGTTANFSITVGGTGPFTYQWLFNGIPNIVTTVTGIGNPTYSGDGGLATSASLSSPESVAFDANGNMYVGDTSNNRIRMVNTNGIISTVAGNGLQTYAGDGGAAINASFYQPGGVAIDSRGNLYIVDQSNNRIRMVNTNGIISTVAGNSASGYSGDGGPATNASLYAPTEVTLDAAGNLFIADEYNHRIRMVNTNGIINTVAGNGTGTYAGDGGPATNASLHYPNGVAFDASGNLYIADTSNGRIRMVNTNGIISTLAGNSASGYSGDGGPATNASLSSPEGLAFDATGNLFIADEFNHRIRKVNTNGIINTVAGSGASGYSSDGGPATNASLNRPLDVAVDASGNLYIADFLNHRIREVHCAGPNFTIPGANVTNAGQYSVIVTSPYGSVVSANATLTLAAPVGITAQPVSQTVQAGTNLLLSVTVVGSGPYGYLWYFQDTNLVQSGTNNTLNLPNILTSSMGDYTIVVTNPYGTVTSQVATLTVVPAIITIQPTNQTAVPGSSPVLSVTVAGSGPFGYSWFLNGTNLVQSGTNSALTLPNVSPTNAGNYLVVITNFYGSVTSQPAALTLVLPPKVATQPYSQTNFAGATVNFSVAVGNTSPGPFTYQWQLNGTNLPSNLISTVAGKIGVGYSGDGGLATNSTLSSPFSVAFDASGNLYIADTSNNRIRKVDQTGIITTVAGNGTTGYSGDGGAATSAFLNNPRCVAFDFTGNLFIADTSNGRIRMVNTNGIISTVAGNGTNGYFGDGGLAINASINNPNGVAVDASGNLFIADQSNYRVREVMTNGIITTFAGTGLFGFSGDGSSATNAKLYNPSGLAFDKSGNIYISDQANNRIRMVSSNGIITTVAGKISSGFSGDGGSATNATLNSPHGVIFDSIGNFYIVDTSNYRIRKVSTDATITTVAGNGSSGSSLNGVLATSVGLYLPEGAAFDANGNLFIADTIDSRIREVLLYATYPTLTLNKLDATNAGIYTVITANSYGSVTNTVVTLTVVSAPVINVQPASQYVLIGSNATLNVAASGTPPLYYSWFSSGTNFIQNATNNAITVTQVVPNTSSNYVVVVSNAYGTATSQVATLSVALPPTIINQPVNQTNLVHTSASFSITANGTGPFYYQWRFNGSNILNYPIKKVAQVYQPYGLTYDGQGNLFIASYDNSIYKLATNGAITVVCGTGNGASSGDGGAATNASINFPQDVVVDKAGNLFITELSGRRIRKIGTNGIISTVAGNGSTGASGDGGLATLASFSDPSGIAIDNTGNLYFSCFFDGRVRKVDLKGIITTVAGNGSSVYNGDGVVATNTGLNHPQDVAVDSQGNIFIAENSGHIRKVNTNGIISIFAGNLGGVAGFSGDGGSATNALLNNPESVKFDGFGNVLIADANNNRIRKVDPRGIISTLVGTSAGLNLPSGMATDNAGNLFIADFNNSRIQKVYFGGLPTLTLTNLAITNAGNYSVVVTSPFGSITSAVASLTVTIPTNPPQISASGTNFGFTTSQPGFGFNFIGAFGQTIIIDGSTDLVNWLPLFTNSSKGNPVYFFDPAWTNYPLRYYRARLP